MKNICKSAASLEDGVWRPDFAKQMIFAITVASSVWVEFC